MKKLERTHKYVEERFVGIRVVLCFLNYSCHFNPMVMNTYGFQNRDSYVLPQGENSSATIIPFQCDISKLQTYLFRPLQKDVVKKFLGYYIF